MKIGISFKVCSLVRLYILTKSIHFKLNRKSIFEKILKYSTEYLSTFELSLSLYMTYSSLTFFSVYQRDLISNEKFSKK